MRRRRRRRELLAANGFDVAGRELSPRRAPPRWTRRRARGVATLAWSAGSGNPCSFKALADDESSATFACAFPFRKSSDCVAEYEQSPFDSIARVVVDLGHDDHGWVRSVNRGPCWARRSWGGCVGVLVLALPVTVIGSNFSAAFHRGLAEKAFLKRQRVAERKQNASAKNSASSSPSFSRLASLNENN